jgi:hypothetical protein
MTWLLSDTIRIGCDRHEFTNWLDDTLARTFAYSCRHSGTAIARVVSVNRTYEPTLVLRAQYAKKAAVYAEVYPTLKALNRK